MAIERRTVESLLVVRDGRLVRRESQILEFKKSFNFGAGAEYFRDFAAFANNRGGYLIFGVEDSPRRPIGLSESAWQRFNDIDPRRITERVLAMFAPDVRWEQQAFIVDGKYFGVIRVHEADKKPVIARKNQGPVRDGEIYYRYRGQTQKIRHAEIERIIAERMETTNKRWIDLLRDIGQIGISNAAVLDTTRSGIEGDASKVLVIDDNLGKTLSVPGGRYVPQQAKRSVAYGQNADLTEAEGVVWTVRESLTEMYPYSAMEVARRVKQRVTGVTNNMIWRTIADHNLKNDERYAVYNFRSRTQKQTYRETGLLPAVTPTIYNDAAIDFIADALADTGTGGASTVNT